MPDEHIIVDNSMTTVTAVTERTATEHTDSATKALIDALRAGREYGRGTWGGERSVLVEFVSAHPNVPLSVAHARGGVVGDLLAALHSASGFEVQREFYVNDAENSRPLRLFARAVFESYRRLCGMADSDRSAGEPDYGGGAFIDALARRIYEAEGDRYVAAAPDEPAFAQLALRASEDEQRDALNAFGIRFDQWTRESVLTASGAVAKTVEKLIAAECAERRGGALWLHAERFGDEADRMLVRADGTVTYLAADLAYHSVKFERGFERLIDVWNADHATYVARTRAGLEALGFEPTRLDVVLVQTVRILKDGTAVKGGSTSADGVTLRELIEELGSDATRFSLALSPVDATLDVDMDAVHRTSAPFGRIRAALDVPVVSVDLDAIRENIDAGLLTESHEQTLLQLTCDFPAVVEEATRSLKPHRLAVHALALADALLRIEGSHSKSESNAQQTHAALLAAAHLSLENALILIGIPPREDETALNP